MSGSVTKKAAYLPSRGRLLTQSELREAINALDPRARLRFSLLVNGLNALVFGVAGALTIALHWLTFAAVSELRDDSGLAVFVGLVALTALMVCIGFSDHPVPERALPGETLATSARRAAFSGVRGGLWLGFLFGCLWGFLLNLNVIYVLLNTALTVSFSLVDVLKYGAAMAVAVVPGFVLWRVAVCVSGTLLVHRLRGQGGATG